MKQTIFNHPTPVIANTTFAKVIGLLFLAIVSLVYFTGCVKNDLAKKKNQGGYYECNIEGDVTVQFKAEGDCGKVSAKYFPLSQDFDDYRSIIIQGFDGKQIVSIILYFKGSFPTNPVFDLDADAYGGNFGVGNYVPDAYNTSSINYSTDERKTGTCTITEYDQTNQTISGTFSFAAQGYNNGATLAGVEVGLSGKFTNVPIVDLSDPNNPKGPCYNSDGTMLGQGGNDGNNGGSNGGNNNGNNGNNNGGNSGNGNGNSTITFKNPIFTPIEITFNGETKNAPAGGTAVFRGMAGANGNGNATTSGKTSSGTPVGLSLSWQLNLNFPSANTNFDYTLNAGGDVFFLKIKNSASRAITKVYVNYGLQAQTVDNITLTNDGNTYYLGYYKAFSNSNVRGENGTYSWFWQNLGLSSTQNQSVTLQAVN